MQSKDWADRRKAIDPSIYRTKDYTLNIQVPTAQGEKGGNSVTIDNTPWVLDMITHGIYAEGNDTQDGNYALQFRDDQTIYNTAPTMSHCLYGSVFKGNKPIEPALRMFFRGSSTLSIDVINLVNRGPDPAFFTIQILFKGFQRWDSPRE